MTPIRRSLWRTLLLSVLLFGLVSAPLAAQGGAWQTGLSFQNLATGSSDYATIQVDFYDSVGAVKGTLMQAGVLPGGGTTFYLPAEAGAPAGTFSAEVSSDRPVAGIVNSINRSAQVGDSYLGTRDVDLSNNVVAPLVYRNFGGYNTTLYVQNAHNQTQDIKLYLAPVGQGERLITTYTVPAYATKELNLQDGAFSALGTGIGSARLEGTLGNVALVASYFRNPNASSLADNIVGQYAGINVSQAATTLYAPLVYKRHNNWDSGISVYNPNDAEANITITFIASGLSSYAGQTFTTTRKIGKQGMENFYLPAIGAIPAPGFFGAARIQSDRPVQAVANAVKYTPNGASIGSCYAAISLAQATPRVSAPLVYRNWGQAETGVNFQNLGNQATNVTLTVVTTNTGATLTRTINNVQPGGADTFYLPTLFPNPTIFYGSATVTSSNGQPLGVLVTSPSYARGYNANYVGIGIQ
ncbi:MAG: hypothetical protein ACOX2L_03995 [Anaerolineae bacterium]|jgi:hypothetical protein|nr:hypothetical protein [Chloroflexota bacterium]